MWPQLSRSWCSLVSLHQTLEAVSPSNMHVSPSGQSMSASCAIQCKSMFSLTSVYLQPSKSHSLCIHTVLDPLLVRTHHASGTCSCLCASAEAAPTVPQCRFHVPFLCSCNGSSIECLYTNHNFQEAFNMQALVLCLLILQADCMLCNS
jgi:hypothetical protein